MSFTAIYYSTANLHQALRDACLERLQQAVEANGGELVTITTWPCQAGRNQVLEQNPHCHLDIYGRILAGCEMASHERVFMTEHDVLYPDSYFDEGLAVLECFPGFFSYNINYVHLDSEGWYEGEHIRILSQLFAPTAMVADAFAAKREWLLDNIAKGESPYILNEPGEATNIKTYTLTNPPVDIRHSMNFTTFGRTRPSVDHYAIHPYWGAASQYNALWTS
jgi:hypothetical protein